MGMIVGQIYFFRQITTFIKVRVAFVFGLQTLQLIDFRKIYQIQGLKPKNKAHTNFYECCDLTKKVYLLQVLITLYLLARITSSSNFTLTTYYLDRQRFKSSLTLRKNVSAKVFYIETHIYVLQWISVFFLVF